MSEEVLRSLSHFASYRFSQSFWGLEREERGQALRAIREAMKGGVGHTYAYQVFPARASLDFLLWSALPLEGGTATAEFFGDYSKRLSPFRHWIEPVQFLWGYTGKSTYSRARSAQEIDPFSESRPTYLVVYPFIKTKEWYLMGRDARQGMMNEHIRLGKGYSEIKQLLLYSFGLQDHEFVVVYEMEELPLFSDLVHELRATEARRYTELDTPLITGVRRSWEDWIGLWGGQA